MSRQHHDRRRSKALTDLDMPTFLNLMVVLVPFLLITAVFSRITVIELSLPTQAGGNAAPTPALRVEVIVREEGLVLMESDTVIAQIPKIDDAYDLSELNASAVTLKRRHPDHDDASVLLEPNIEYDHLIQVMDAMRSAVITVDGQTELTRVALFTNLSIGDAP